MKKLEFYKLIFCSIGLLLPIGFKYLLRKEMPSEFIVLSLEINTKTLISILGLIVCILILRSW